MLRNQAQMLLWHERIETTVPKAKELRPFVERLITIAKRGLAEDAESGRVLHARRLVGRDLVDRETATKLFDTIAPRYASRPGGYTRLLRTGYRRGDSVEMAQVELIGSEYRASVEAPKSEEVAAPKTKTKTQGVGGRIRAAAQRMRGRKAAKSAAGNAADDPAAGQNAEPRGRPSPPARKASRKKSS
jgi:large subunit ribosomal protein L17